MSLNHYYNTIIVDKILGANMVSMYLMEEAIKFSEKRSIGDILRNQLLSFPSLKMRRLFINYKMNYN